MHSEHSKYNSKNTLARFTILSKGLETRLHLKPRLVYSCLLVSCLLNPPALSFGLCVMVLVCVMMVDGGCSSWLVMMVLTRVLGYL